MSVIDEFSGLERTLRALEGQLKRQRTQTGQASSERITSEYLIAQIQLANESFRKCVTVLESEKAASEKAKEALQMFVKETKMFVENEIDYASGNFMLGFGGTRRIRPSTADIKRLAELSSTLKETVTLFETIEKMVQETLENSQQSLELSAEAQDELNRKREAEEAERRRLEEEEKERQRQEEERKRREEEERKKGEEEERKRREEERQRLEEEERKRREEEEERQRLEEEERQRLEEEERQRLEEEERQRLEEEERQRREEEERQRREEEEQKRREEEERKRLEEVERQRLEEEERQRLEEEERQRQKEEKRLAELRQQQAQQEARRREEERQSREDERLLREEESSWKPVVVPLQNSSTGLRGLERPGCAIRAPQDAFILDEFRCQESSPLPRREAFQPHEVTGRAIRLEGIGRSELGGRFRGRQTQWFVAMPYSESPRPGKETVLYAYKNDNWNELPAAEIRHENLSSGYNWIETKISELPITLVTVTRWKVQRSILGSQEARLTNPADSRTSLTIPSNSVSPKNAKLDQAFEVRPVQQTVIDELRSRSEDFDGVLSSSCLTIYTLQNDATLSSTVSYSVHVPKNNSQRHEFERITNVEPSSRGNERRASVMPESKRRQSLISGGNIDNLPQSEQIIFATSSSNDKNSRWNVLAVFDGENTSKEDVFHAKISNFSSHRLLALRTTNTFDTDHISPVCNEIVAGMETQTVSFVVRQSADTTKAIVALPPMESKQAYLEHFTSNGFTLVRGRAPSLATDQLSTVTELRVRERQELQIEFTGNITGDQGDCKSVIYSSGDLNVWLFALEPKNEFAQSAQPAYRGFVQVFSELQPNQLAKQALELAKPKRDKRPALKPKSPFVLKAKDAVTEDFLADLASKVEQNWHILAEHLGVSKERCSAIRSNYLQADEQAFQMLIAWVQSTTVRDSKVELLSTALKSAGYSPLAKELRRRQRELLEEKQSMRNENY